MRRHEAQTASSEEDEGLAKSDVSEINGGKGRGAPSKDRRPDSDIEDKIPSVYQRITKEI